MAAGSCGAWGGGSGLRGSARVEALALNWAGAAGRHAKMGHVTHAAPFARDRALESAPFYMTRSPGRGIALVPATLPASAYAADCRRCPRLAAFLDAVHAEHPQYY